MKRRDLLKGIAAGAATLAIQPRLWAQTDSQNNGPRPNILWLVIEDTSAYEFGCYGNAAVKTPTVDGLAARGVRFDHAWSAGPQCSPSRASIISGGFGTTYGMDWHRRQVQVPGDIFFPPLLRKAGYFCTNNAKTDYNAKVAPAELWDENGAQATYNSPNRAKNQPFYAVFNCGATHMSRIRSFSLEGRRDFASEGLDPAKLALPPHVPDLPEIRSDYAFHLEGVQDIDGWVKSFLDDLEDQGLAEDTIVFFSSDHGGCLPRGKGFLFNTGLQVPLVAYVPPKFRALTKITPGSSDNQLVHLMDLGPTFLSLAGVQPPSRMQGRALWGRYAAAPRQYQFAFAANQAAHYVPSRAISDGRYHLIRSYTPHKPYSLRNGFQWGMPSNLAWDEYALSGKAKGAHIETYRPHAGEVLFDLRADPYEVNDLGSDPKFRDIKQRLSTALDSQLLQTGDLGFFPPFDRQDDDLYRWTQDTKYPLQPLLDAARLAASPTKKDAAKLTANLRSEKPEIRFWAASGFAALAVANPDTAVPAELITALQDTDPYVAAEAAHALVYLGQDRIGAPFLVKAFGAKSKAAYSALETLALTPVGKAALKPYIEQLQKLANGEAVETEEPAAKSDDEAGEEGSNSAQARGILINLGELPVAQLYGPSQFRNGRRVNRERKPLNPGPKGRVKGGLAAAKS